MADEKKLTFKNYIRLSMDEFPLKEMRRILFGRGLNPSEFLKYIVQLVSERDERLDSIINELSVEKSNKLVKGGIESSRDFDVNNLYDAIEAKMKLKENSNEEQERE